MPQNKTKVLQIPNYIKNTSKILLKVNKKLAVLFALKLFETPIKYKLPKRELKMFDVSNKQKITLEKSNKEILVYENNFGPKKVLLVHGWNGRGTQLVSIAKMFKELNYDIITFDAPGHGFTKKDSANMTHFIEAILQLNKKYNGFDIIVGHSLGGMSTINSISRGLNVDKAVIIGSGNKTTDIVIDYLTSIGLPTNLTKLFVAMFNKKHNDDIKNYDVDLHAKKVKIPVLVIHDENDIDVPVSASKQVVNNLENGTLLITKNLGHRKILGDESVINEIKKFATT